MLKLHYTAKFKRDLKKVKKRGLEQEKLVKIVDMLLEEKTLPAKYHDHMLKNNWIDHRECHIEPDWLLIYQIEQPLLKLVRTGTHADLF